MGHFQIYATRNVTSLESREHDQMLYFMRLRGYLKYPHTAQSPHVGTVRFSEYISTPILETKARRELKNMANYIASTVYE